MKCKVSIMIAQSCLHTGGAFNSWRIHVPTSFYYYLPMPMKVQSSAAKAYWREELAEEVMLMTV
jgi:hypothetical protein